MVTDIVFITGANTGIGLETVKHLLSSSVSYQIILGSRSVAKGEAAAEGARKANPTSTSTIEVLQIDITDDDSISKAVKTIKNKYGKLDVLVNNAGGSFDSPFGASPATIREEFNKAYDLNVSGTHVLTYTAAPLLLKSSNPRLLFITSGTSSLERAPKPLNIAVKPAPAGWPKPPMFTVMGYRASKTALNMLMLNWCSILKEDGVKVWCISPGFLATNLGGSGPEILKSMGAGDPSAGGIMIRNVMEGKWDDHVGKVVNAKDIVQPW